MIRTNQRANDYLCRVVERFQFHSEASKSDNPMVAEMASKMREIEIWEMWVLTQE